MPADLGARQRVLVHGQLVEPADERANLVEVRLRFDLEPPYDQAARCRLCGRIGLLGATEFAIQVEFQAVAGRSLSIHSASKAAISIGPKTITVGNTTGGSDKDHPNTGGATPKTISSVRRP
jgi:hypothetical protein